jgi:hydroxymethylpyrimidine/phosphomethylpyrimidine kinase
VTIAGSDSSGGAGMQADLKAIAAHGCHGCSVVTAITAQNRQGVNLLFAIPPALLLEQMKSIVNESPVGAIKIGMVGWLETVTLIAEMIAPRRSIPVVLDPVMWATSGSPLATDEAINGLRERLIPCSTVVTPNFQEAERLLGRSISDVEVAATELLQLGAKFVVIKGGDREGESADDCVAFSGGIHWLRASRIAMPRRGTGCTFASAIACNLALGQPPLVALERAKRYMSGYLQC